jgi:signal transduction histidine kinase/ActR/RegA family two-component response regulator
MVPSTAFSFVCVGLGIAAAAAASGRFVRWVVLVLAAIGASLPALTIFEYATGSRLGIESVLGIPFPAGDSVAGRMSPLSSLSVTLLAASLAALVVPGRAGDSAVRIAAGTTLTMSWLAVLAVSFDATRLENLPTFPGMAVPTIGLLAISSVAILGASPHAMARLHGVHMNAAIAPSTLFAVFAVPLLLGQARNVLLGYVDPGLAAGLVILAFAASIAAVVWRILSRLHAFQQQRERLLADLEGRVDDRTLALAVANRQLYHSESQLREADRRKDEFLATLAHELRNPLAPIRTGLAILKNSASPPPAIAQAHQVIGRQMQHLVRLIDDLLDVSRITAKKLELRLERLDVRDVVQHSIETSWADIDNAQHELVVSLPPTPLHVLGDPTRLTQIVANLLQNASKYTPQRGRIEISAMRCEDVVEIAVRDNGIGIASEHVPLLFETFSQVVPGLQRGGGGLGLGLALVRGLVALHGGEVEVRSEGLGRGSEFVVRLNGAPPEVAAAAPSEPVVASAGTIRRILVVDDNVDNTEALCLYLRDRGHDVRPAYDGEEACRVAEEFRPDVVLLDIGLPGKTGHDVCRYLRAQPWGAEMLVVAQTGWGQQADRQQSRLAGFDAHLVKPVDPMELVALAEGGRRPRPAVDPLPADPLPAPVPMSTTESPH